MSVRCVEIDLDLDGCCPCVAKCPKVLLVIRRLGYINIACLHVRHGSYCDGHICLVLFCLRVTHSAVWCAACWPWVERWWGGGDVVLVWSWVVVVGLRAWSGH